jgi:hypothetical protein
MRYTLRNKTYSQHGYGMRIHFCASCGCNKKGAVLSERPFSVDQINLSDVLRGS